MTASARHLFPAIFLSLFFACGGCTGDIPVAKRGVIDLSRWDFTRDGSVPLRGEWEIYPGRFLDPSAGSARSAVTDERFILQPGSWNNHRFDGKPLGPHGFATLRLTVLLPKKDGPMTLSYMLAFSAHRLYANGAHVIQSGEPSPNEHTERIRIRPQAATCRPDAQGKITLLFHMSNHWYYYGGMLDTITLGLPQAIERTLIAETIALIFVFSIILGMALYHLALYLLRPNDSSTVLFSIFCFSSSLHTLVINNSILFYFMPNLCFSDFYILNHLIFFISLAAFIGYLRSLFPDEFPAWLSHSVLTISIVSTLITIGGTVTVIKHLLTAFQFTTVFLIVYTVVALARAVKQHRFGTRIFLLGFISLAAATLNDILVYEDVYAAPFIYPFGLLCFLVSQTYLIAKKFSHAFQTAETLSVQLESKNVRLLELDRLKDEFLATTSHELRTPLNGIIGLAETLLDDTATPPVTRRTLSMIAASGLRLTTLVNDILDFVRIRNRDIALHVTPVDIKTLGETVLALMRSLAVDKDITLENRIPEGLPFAAADENRIQQVLYNLIGNAIKFTLFGAIVVEAREFVEDGGGRFLEVSVTDTGVGIPKNDQDRIFAMFEQASGSLERTHNGAGLGLAITKKIIELHGGTINVESKPGEGSRFYFTLPVCTDPSPPTASRTRGAVPAARPAAALQPAEDASSFHSAAPAPAGNGHILVVDDDPVNCEVARGFLEHGGYTVAIATRADEAIDRILEAMESAGGQFDLILLDIMMPHISGLTACSMIRERYALFELPILIFTALGSMDDLIRAFESGANDYLVKPVRRDELLARVRTLIALKREVQEHRDARLLLLQNRMKPHFLFNALNTIHALIQSDASGASEAVIALAAIYRFLIDGARARLIPFDEEWEFTAAYLDFQAIQYGSQLDIVRTREGEFADVLVPPLIIQPLAENCFKHAFRELDGVGRIVLRAERRGGAIRITVTDNGTRSTGVPSYERTLGNIRDRLKLTYDTADVVLENADGGGTSVTITFHLPLVHAKPS